MASNLGKLLFIHLKSPARLYALYHNVAQCKGFHPFLSGMPVDLQVRIQVSQSREDHSADIPTDEQPPQTFHTL
jgi:hypothetical protein